MTQKALLSLGKKNMAKRKSKIKSREIVINLNKKFYDLGTIKESLDDFRAVCSGKVKNTKRGFRIVLKANTQSPNLGHEFSNYVLGLMKNKMMI